MVYFFSDKKKKVSFRAKLYVRPVRSYFLWKTSDLGTVGTFTSSLLFWASAIFLFVAPVSELSFLLTASPPLPQVLGFAATSVQITQDAVRTCRSAPLKTRASLWKIKVSSASAFSVVMETCATLRKIRFVLNTERKPYISTQWLNIMIYFLPYFLCNHFSNFFILNVKWNPLLFEEHLKQTF